MSKNKALGKGLDALLELNSEMIDINNYAEMDRVVVDDTDKIIFVSLDRIEANPNQPRKTFDEDSLVELAESIKQKGVIQPVLAEKNSEKEGYYIIVAGERRYRASRLAGIEQIPLIVRSFSEEDKLEIALIENIQRENLTPIEEARAYRHIMETLNLNQQDLADRVGKNRSTVANSLRLLKLPEDMQDSLNEGKLTSGHARSILSTVNPADQRILFNRIVDKGLTVREAETMAGDLNKGSRPTSKKEGIPKKKIPEIMHVEQKFIDVFGTKVQIKGNINKGKIEITYYSSDDLDRIFEIISND
ncbi:ParB/RepB/Spo0J family partition protein [Spirochaeta isovalerica]|uniref:ParB family chromosome partitioning protein n=1 Tax=Spirochaeta isovalerica TaxID=150 RepID=A0A841RE33_9SPIO|nr:ParB family chromosome partitioning protein [Spirochaeta isovalerica]